MNERKSSSVVQCHESLGCSETVDSVKSESELRTAPTQKKCIKISETNESNAIVQKERRLSRRRGTMREERKVTKGKKVT
jgi:hypothetical protein